MSAGNWILPHPAQARLQRNSGSSIRTSGCRLDVAQLQSSGRTWRPSDICETGPSSSSWSCPGLRWRVHFDLAAETAEVIASEPVGYRALRASAFAGATSVARGLT